MCPAGRPGLTTRASHHLRGRTRSVRARSCSAAVRASWTRRSSTPGSSTRPAGAPLLQQAATHVFCCCFRPAVNSCSLKIVSSFPTTFCYTPSIISHNCKVGQLFFTTAAWIRRYAPSPLPVCDRQTFRDSALLAPSSEREIEKRERERATRSLTRGSPAVAQAARLAPRAARSSIPAVQSHTLSEERPHVDSPSPKSIEGNKGRGETRLPETPRTEDAARRAGAGA